MQSAATTLPSLDVAFDLARQQLTAQLAQADALDTKAGLILASASLLVSVLTAWRAPHIIVRCSWLVCRIPPVSSEISQVISFAQFIAAWLPLIAVGVYAVVIIFAARAYALRDFDNPPWPGHLDGYLARPAEVTKGTLLSNIVIAYRRNARMIEDKVKWTRRAFIAFWAEAAAVGVMMLFLTVLSTPIVI